MSFQPIVLSPSAIVATIVAIVGFFSIAGIFLVLLARLRDSSRADINTTTTTLNRRERRRLERHLSSVESKVIVYDPTTTSPFPFVTGLSCNHLQQQPSIPGVKVYVPEATSGPVTFYNPNTSSPFPDSVRSLPAARTRDSRASVASSLSSYSRTSYDVPNAPPMPATAYRGSTSTPWTHAI